MGDLTKDDFEKSLRVRKIKNGTVIDHISSGNALNVLKIVGITGKGGMVISVAMNVPSGKSDDLKDVVKIENKELAPEEINRIALISPNATINIIRDYEVIQKFRVVLEEKIEGVIKCMNPNCITNGHEPVKSLFKIEQTTPISLRCFYCERTIQYNDIVKQF
ncbi:MAG: aspartate carbamoyltransferase regulatory subunit [Candidatus Helarchaeota archaeon]|nr:aspartate carbamoyltransferase regulatory subunit [Candidatus Helarchaeota archaeon]